MTNRKQSYREVLGQWLKAFRLDRGLTAYAVARDGQITIGQVNAVEEGIKNYTIETFLGYISGSGLCMYFAENEHTGDGHDFDADDITLNPAFDLTDVENYKNIILNKREIVKIEKSKQKKEAKDDEMSKKEKAEGDEDMGEDDKGGRVKSE